MPSSCATRMYSVCIEGGEFTDAIRSLNGAWGAAGVIRLTRRHSAAGTVAYFDISFFFRSLLIRQSHPDETEPPSRPRCYGVLSPPSIPAPSPRAPSHLLLR